MSTRIPQPFRSARILALLAALLLAQVCPAPRGVEPAFAQDAEGEEAQEPWLDDARLADAGQQMRVSRSGRAYTWFLQYADAEAVAKTLADSFATEISSSALRVQPNKSGNAVLVSCKDETAKDAFRTTVDLMKELDRRVGQVMIEVLIADVTIERGDERGFNWRYNGFNLAGRSGLSGAAEVDHTYLLEDADIEAERLALKGAKVAIDKTDRLRGFIHGLISRNRLHVLASPKIVATNNREATLSIEDHIPFVKGQTLNENGRFTSTYEDFVAKMELKVTPRVGQGDTIILDVTQSLDEMGEYDEVNRVATKTKRELVTSLVLDDHQTAALGGFITNRRERTGEKIPYLSSLPGIGPLFSQKAKKDDRTELMIFLTPKVLVTEEDGRHATENLRRRLAHPERLAPLLAERRLAAPPKAENERTLVPRAAPGWAYAPAGPAAALLGRSDETVDTRALLPAAGGGGHPAPFGYGDVALESLVYATKLPAKPGYAFRRGFEVEDPSAFTGLSLRVASCGAALVYVNGTLVDLDPDVRSEGGHDANYWNRYVDGLAPGLLRRGANEVYAVLRNDKGSEGAFFDLELSATLREAAAAGKPQMRRSAPAPAGEAKAVLPKDAAKPAPASAPSAAPAAPAAPVEVAPVVAVPVAGVPSAAAAPAPRDDDFARVKARWLARKERPAAK